jgi:hypothetical protein
MSPHRLPALSTPAQARLVTTIYSSIAAALAEVQVWRMKRQLLSMDPGLFKDAGVSPGQIDWLVRHGRGS